MCDFIKEIVERMPAVEQASKEYKQTLVEVGTFLEKSGEHLDRTLGALEAAMVKEINSRLAEGQPQLDDKKSIGDAVARLKDHKQKLPGYLQHVLTTVLSKHESDLGFKLFGEGENLAAATYTGFVEPEEFRQRLMDGMQFKDPTVPGGHGEFTHRIQWYLITNNLKEPPGKWVEFYKWIGTVRHTQAVQGDKPAWKDQGLWDVPVDRNQKGSARKNGPYDTGENSDFRSPENLHDYILTTLPESCPLLTSFMSRRELTRKDSGLRLSEVAIREYVAKKIFGAGYDRLYHDDKAVVDEAMKSKLLLPGSRRQPRTLETVVREKANAALEATKEKANAALEAMQSLKNLFNS